MDYEICYLSGVLQLWDTFRRISIKVLVGIGYSASYKVKNFDLQIPIDHRLPLYQSQFANYDRFLPHLAKQLDSNDLVIDIGANVGDTVAAMLLENPNLRFQSWSTINSMSLCKWRQRLVQKK